MKRLMIITIGALVLTVMTAGVGWLLLCGDKSKLHATEQSDNTTKVLPALWSNEQMLEFILKSAKEWFNDPDVTLSKVEFSRFSSALEVKLIVPPLNSESVDIFLCADSVMKELLMTEISDLESTKVRSHPITIAQYGNMVMIYHGQNGSVESFLETAVIDTREVMVAAECWQRWLAERGVVAEISDDGFTMRGVSLLPYLLEINDCQVLHLLIDGQKAEILCFADSANVRFTLNEHYSNASVMEIWDVVDSYSIRGPYGRVLVNILMDENKENSGRIGQLIKEFWSQQN